MSSKRGTTVLHAYVDLAIHIAGNFGTGEFGEHLLSQGSINLSL